MRADLLFATFLCLSAPLLAQGITGVSAGGAVQGQRESLEDPPGPQVDVTLSTHQTLRCKITFPAPSHHSLLSPWGEEYTRLTMPGTDSIDGVPGHPAVPMWRWLVAVPRGAAIVVSSAQPVISGHETLLLAPIQDLAFDGCSDVDDYQDGNPPPDCAYADPNFAYIAEVYAQSTSLPAWSAQVDVIGQARDLTIAQLSVPIGSYLPHAKRFSFYESVEVSIAFQGGEQAFLTTAHESPFENGHLFTSVLNHGLIYANMATISDTLTLAGEELLILAHPDLAEAAYTLTDWKRAKGIPTNVALVVDGEGPGPDTAAEIDDFIEERYLKAHVRPSYLLILGDVELVPTQYVQRLNKPLGTLIATDFFYGNVGDTSQDFLPEMAVGRDSVDTLEQAQVVVAKIVQYELAPPGQPSIEGDPFYSRATIASGFECCRTDVPDGTSNRGFIMASEWCRTRLTNRGKVTDAIYGEYFSSSYTGDTTPRFYYDGTPLPLHLSPAAGFPWDGSASDVLDALQEGRFLVMHISHGWSQGWGKPAFDDTHVAQLTNGEYLPAVYSLNCSTGHFDSETDEYGNTFESFAEQLLRHEAGGAVGVIAGTRMTNTALNDMLAQGFLDATWPDMLLDFGSPTDSQRRLGDVLNHGKLSLLSRLGYQHWNARNHMWLYHLIGDPTLELWTEDPHAITLPDPHIVDSQPGFVQIHYAVEDAYITAWQLLNNGQSVPVGKAQVVNGMAQVAFYVQPVARVPLQLSASLPNAVSHSF